MKSIIYSKIPQGKREYYRATNPKIFEKIAESNLRSIKTALPELTKIQNESTGRPKTTVIEGRTGLLQVYKEIRTANSIRFFSNLGEIYHLFPEEVDKITNAIKQNQIQTENSSQTPQKPNAPQNA